MKIYADALEEWDDKVGDDWDPADSEFLNPDQWIKEDEWFVEQENFLDDVLSSGFDKATWFMSKFHWFIQIYWKNKQFNCNILVHEWVRNPIDSLNDTLSLFDW